MARVTSKYIKLWGGGANDFKLWGGGKICKPYPPYFFSEIALIYILCKYIIVYITFKFNPINQRPVDIDKN